MRILEWIKREVHPMALAAGFGSWVSLAQSARQKLVDLAVGLLGVVLAVCLVLFVVAIFPLDWKSQSGAASLYKSVFQLLPVGVGVAVLAALLALALDGLNHRMNASGIAVGIVLAGTVLLVALLPIIVGAYAIDTGIADDAWVQGRIDWWRGLLIGGVALMTLAWVQRWPELSIGAVPATLVGAAILAIAPFSSPETPKPDPVPTPRQAVTLRDVRLLSAECPAAGTVSVVIVTPKLNEEGKAVGTEAHRYVAKLGANDCRPRPSRHDDSVADLTLAFPRGTDDASLAEVLGELATSGAVVYVAPDKETPTPAPSATASSG